MPASPHYSLENLAIFRIVPLMIRTGLLLVLAIALPAWASARDTAYQALRTAAKSRGDSILGRVVEVQGSAGIPQPEVWKILLDDPAARAGVRELQVAGQRVKSERTPTRAAGANAAMDFSQLNLDSEGAFSIANEEAVKAKLGFDSIDYVLRAGDRRTPPRWELQLLDPRGRSVGTLVIAADTGAIVRKDFARRSVERRDEEVVRDDREFIREETRDRGERDDRGSGGGLLGKADRFGNRVERHMEDHFRHVGGKLQKFFTGRNTVDPNRPEQ